MDEHKDGGYMSGQGDEEEKTDDDRRSESPPRSLMEKLSVLLDSVGMLKWMGVLELLWSLSVARITCTT